MGTGTGPGEAVAPIVLRHLGARGVKTLMKLEASVAFLL